jgi:microcompartment protein CcmK/EutM
LTQWALALAAGDALGRKAAAVDAAVIGIVDRIDVSE